MSGEFHATVDQALPELPFALGGISHREQGRGQVVDDVLVLRSKVLANAGRRSSACDVHSGALLLDRQLEYPAPPLQVAQGRQTLLVEHFPTAPGNRP